MSKICANFQITTPMFLGGADEETAELRPTSLKGVLRFWFRAINYGKYQDYEKVKKIEDDLFGSTDSQSNFFLKLLTQDISVETEQLECNNNISYLGYGLDYEKENTKKTLYRPFIIPGQSFTVEILIKPKYHEQLDIEDLTSPIKALGLFGGLGSRSRRGFGSVTLESICVDDQEYWVAPGTRDEMINVYNEFYSSLVLGENIPKYTAFSKNNRTIILREFNNYRRAMNHVGEAMKNFRKNYGEDTEIIKKFLEGKNIDKYPERVVFGLPHNYYIKKRGEVNISAVIDDKKTRRASPLFIKIVSIKNDSGVNYVPVITIFPSIFLPDGSKISMEEEKLDPVSFFNPDNKVINEFLENFSNKLEVTARD